MSQHYSDPTRETDPHALPDLEVFYLAQPELDQLQADAIAQGGDGADCLQETGWYYWTCFPGCMPDGEPNGPYPTEAEALAAAREGLED